MAGERDKPFKKLSVSVRVWGWVWRNHDAFRAYKKVSSGGFDTVTIRKIRRSLRKKLHNLPNKLMCAGIVSSVMSLEKPRRVSTLLKGLVRQCWFNIYSTPIGISFDLSYFPFLYFVYSILYIFLTIKTKIYQWCETAEWWRATSSSASKYIVSSYFSW
jgi:hypothetical protein